MTDFCQNCGEGIPKGPVEFGKWSLHRDHASRDGKPLKNLTIQQCALLHALASVRPRVLSHSQIVGQISKKRLDEVEDPRSYAEVVVCNTRRKLGKHSPIKTEWGRGYYWDEKCS